MLTRWSIALALVGLTGLGPGNTAAQGVVVTDEPTIAVTGAGRATGAAETATIQILVNSSEAFYGSPFPPDMVPPDAPGPEEATPEAGEAARGQETSSGEVVMNPGPMGPPILTDEDLQPLSQAMVDAGVEEDDIQIVTGPAASGVYGPGGPGGGFVEAEVAQPTREQVGEIVAAVNQAATDNGLLVQHLGVGHDVADCEPLQREALQATIEDARAQSEQIAELVGVTLGDVVQVSSYPFYGPGLPGEDEAGCPTSPEAAIIGPGGTVTTPPFDPTAEAEAEVYAQVNMVFAIAETEGTPTS
ncbi:MAG: SIMPL domain-containing protein [Chloroflexota bacterium]|nr:SIMPL domain-containing protein [Chloroflexota bacterium]